ncbi:hypothetical protein ACFRQM_35795 [Streptomyces sp. NPDC056831]|uniref:hypothetical protein n=1 Tax=Streptomyces sp. NPDC056831 TaxID=3345954 RepID=UPI0036C5A340
MRHCQAADSRVECRHQRDLETRSISVRGVWDRAVDAWIDGDKRELEAVWDDIMSGGLGTDWDAYTHVSSVGWAT